MSDAKFKIYIITKICVLAHIHTQKLAYICVWCLNLFDTGNAKVCIKLLNCYYTFNAITLKLLI